MSNHEPNHWYVLTTAPLMPSKSNLWGTQAGSSPEDASTRFKARIQKWYSPIKTGYLALMDEDRHGVCERMISAPNLPNSVRFAMEHWSDLPCDWRNIWLTFRPTF
jgi:hypothetical protein